MIDTLALQRAACLALSLFAALSLAGVVPSRRDALTACLAGAGVPFSLRNSTEWTRETTPYNLRLPYTPAELNMQIYMAATGQTVQGVYYGDRSGLDAALKPLLDDLGAGVTAASTVGWIEGLEHFADGTALDQRFPYDQHSTFYKTSLMTHALSDEQITSFATALFDNIADASARHSWYVLLDLHGGDNSAVAAVAPSATAYVHRDKLLLYQFSDRGADGEYPDEGFALLKGFRESVTGSMADGEWGMYANYVDAELDAQTAQELYWGGNLARLKRLKAVLDPDEVFWNPQGVRPIKE